MREDYVQRRDGNVYVGQSRVTIDSVILPWQAGQTPEQIHDDYPTLALAEVYGAIAYYLEHRDEMGAWLRQTAENWRLYREQREAAGTEARVHLRDRLAAYRDAAQQHAAQRTSSGGQSRDELPDASAASGEAAGSAHETRAP